MFVICTILLKRNKNQLKLTLIFLANNEIKSPSKKKGFENLRAIMDGTQCDGLNQLEEYSKKIDNEIQSLDTKLSEVLRR